jgi:radical SAM protein with 4Fe4S-binding SPASM domain
MNIARREFYFQFHINRDCNLRCKHCYQEEYSSRTNARSEHLDIICQHIIQAAKAWNCVARVALTGGEPLLCDSIWSLLDQLSASEHVGTLTVLSNGTLIQDLQARRLAQYPKMREIQISLDGATSYTHDAVRGAGAFSGAMDGIRSLKNSGLSVAIMFTLMRDNMAEALAVLELARENGVDFVTIERVVPCHTNDLQRDALSPSEVSRVYKEVHEWAETQPDKGHKVTVRRRRPLWNLVSDTVGGFCPVGFTALAVLDDGTILPCRRMEIPIGNVIEDRGFFKAWYTADVLWNLRRRANLGGMCGTCDHASACGGCRALAYNMTGDYMKGDPQCWLTKNAYLV